MKKPRSAVFDVAVFCASRLLDALVLIALLWAVSALDSQPALISDPEADLYGLYLVVRAYFILLGYLPLSVAMFIAMEFAGGIRARSRLMILNVGVPLFHGLIFGILLRTATASYWIVGIGMLLVAALATNWMWWPWLARNRN